MSAARERRERAGVFQAVVREDGAVPVPAPVLEALVLGAGSRVQVRLSAAQDTARLQRLGIAEDEVERICLLQGEDRSRVVRFLLSEGVLARRGGVRRR